MDSSLRLRAQEIALRRAKGQTAAIVGLLVATGVLIGLVALAFDGEHPGGDSDLVRKSEAFHPQEGTRQMQRRWQVATPRRGDASAGLKKIVLAVKANVLIDAQPPVKIEQVHAAAQQHVLAIVDHIGFIYRDRKRHSPAAQESARFVQIDRKSGAS